MKYELKFVDRCNMCGSKSLAVVGKRMNQSQGFAPHKKIGITTTIVECSDCGLIFPDPMPVPESIADHYGVTPESYWKPEYFVVEPEYFGPQIKAFHRLYQKHEGLVALDIGAGIGKCMVALNNSGFDTFGFEPSEPFYKKAIDVMGIKENRLKLTSMENAEYEENFFDFITFGAVLEHLYDPSASIIKAMKWTKPGGLVYIQVPSSKWLVNKIFNLTYKIRGLDYVANLSPMHNPFHLYEFSLKSFQDHAEKHSYEIVSFDYFVCQTFLPKILDPVLKPIMEITNTGMQLEVWLRKK